MKLYNLFFLKKQLCEWTQDMKGILQVGFGLEMRLDVLLHSSFTCSRNATTIQFPKTSHLVGLSCSIHYCALRMPIGFMHINHIACDWQYCWYCVTRTLKPSYILPNISRQDSDNRKWKLVTPTQGSALAFEFLRDIE